MLEKLTLFFTKNQYFHHKIETIQYRKRDHLMKCHKAPNLESLLNALQEQRQIVSPEQVEHERRMSDVIREIKSLVDRIHDIKAENSESFPEELAHLDQKSLINALVNVISDQNAQLKKPVIQKMARKIGDYLIWRREVSIPVIHELLVLLPWWIANLPLDAVHTLRDLGLKYIINGQVLPVQLVWKELLDARLVYMGHCVCRSSGITDDLYQNEQVYTFLDEPKKNQLLDRFINRYKSLLTKHGHLPDTDPMYEKLCQKLLYYQKNDAREYCLETLLTSTYGNWEFLPVLDKYTPSWIHSMHKNHKAHQLHRELAFELATIQYLARGAIFTTMKIFDQPYTICTCPPPETGGGCVLTNWYYFGGSNNSLLPNTHVYGQNKDIRGNPIPCRYFPQRGNRACVGCGCNHQKEEPRDFEHLLAQADQTYLNRSIR
ncbi:MAG: hypothetical protein OMM_01638 [Candidatus Magnetoglobus multicellularis str. Araruama]|uniref:Uncharacterized protein n=1 Tax=Candidatus Magnetoglobus multicellularis str. Araruama TaxID=890399 RepID=A0A1V1PCR3_9BACT|nr:MAG: hypothetical protein OMM_01638 [Candidatus Magnetoglobus multicellularis str. Araruama]